MIGRLCYAVLAAVAVGAGIARGDEPTYDWVRVTEHAPWQARDSQGELAFGRRMWIFGGWFDSFRPAPRDVWSSTDGRTWTQVTPEAPWRHSDLSMSLVHNDRMWFMGGWMGGRMPQHEAGHEVWSSTNGADWQQATPRADWSPRLAAAAVVFQGKMWILGGTEDYYFGDAKSLKNDVWSSADGAHWQQVTEHAGWTPRAYHQAVVLGGMIYVLGGGNYVPEYEARHDVWCSRDGAHWRQVTAAAPWKPRLWFSAVVYRDHLWVLGGWSNNPSENLGDVWYSKDGANWKPLRSRVVWKERHEHSAFVFDDKLWVVGGHARPLTNDVWSLELPADWRGD
jgi:hypothetical protein